MIAEELVIGVDVGGTNTVLGVIGGKEELLYQFSFPIIPEDGFNNFIFRLNKNISDCLNRFDKFFEVCGCNR
jgi:predicted NBD/HSP70 family sugar kinase